MMSELTDMAHCPVCNLPLLPDGGSGALNVLIVGEFPGWKEIQTGRLFSGPTGRVLSSELARVGIPLQACRYTNLWRHEFTNEMRKDEAHVSLMVLDLIEKMKWADHILLMGSELARTVLGCGVMEVAGLEVEPPFPFPQKPVTFAPNPASALYSNHGEFRLAIQKFGRRFQERQNG